MDKASNLPMALWKANLDLQTRIGRLMQEGGQQWLEQGTRALGESATEFETEARKLLQAGDWQALAALPVETFWRQAEQRLGDGQAAAQASLQAQESFVAGLTEALQEWQRDLAKAWAVAGIDAGAVPGIPGSWDTMMSNLEQGIAAMAAGATAGRYSQGGSLATPPCAGGVGARHCILDERPGRAVAATACRRRGRRRSRHTTQRAAAPQRVPAGGACCAIHDR